MNKLLIVVSVLLLAGCFSASKSPVLNSSDIEGWPLKSTTAEITCDGEQPIKAKLDNKVTYALNGTTALKYQLEMLNTDSGQILPNPNPKLKALGIEFSDLTIFNTSAEKVCQFLPA